MNTLLLELEFESLKASGDLDGLKSLALMITETHPFAAQMLNYIGYIAGCNAETFCDLQESLRILTRALELAREPKLWAMIGLNLTAFYTCMNATDAGLLAADAVLHTPLAPLATWVHGLTRYHVGHAYLKRQEYRAAEQAFAAALRYPLRASNWQQALVALAMLSARRGDARVVAQQLEQVDDVTLVPHVTMVRARLALALGYPITAYELARQASQAFGECRPRLAIWFAQMEALALCVEALKLSGDTAQMTYMQQVMADLNGGLTYQSAWGQ